MWLSRLVGLCALGLVWALLVGLLAVGLASTEQNNKAAYGYATTVPLAASVCLVGLKRARGCHRERWVLTLRAATLDLPRW